MTCSSSHNVLYRSHISSVRRSDLMPLTKLNAKREVSHQQHQKNVFCLEDQIYGWQGLNSKNLVNMKEIRYSMQTN